MYIYHYCKIVNEYLFNEKIPCDQKTYLIHKYDLKFKGRIKEYWDKNVRILSSDNKLSFQYINDISIIYKDNYLLQECDMKPCKIYSFYNQWFFIIMKFSILIHDR